MRDTARSTFKTLPDFVQRELLRLWYRYGRKRHTGRLSAPTPKNGMVIGAPDFVGIGVPKAGTTWWFSLLSAHPEIHVENQKELVYFNPRTFDRSGQPGGVDDLAQAYREWFPRPPGTKSGEWTPRYLYDRQLPSLLKAVAPECRLLVLLRDPVERYRSHISIHASPSRYLVHRHLALDRGYYSAALQRWESIYSPSEMLVLQFEQCRQSPAEQLAATFRFLGVDASFISPGLTAAVNRTESKRSLPPDLERVLIGLYEADVLALADRYPQIDLRLWPNFAHLVTTDRMGS